MPALSDPTTVDPILAAIADPTRRKAFELLVADGPATATSLATQLGVSRQAVAKHLAQLLSAGLATVGKVGREARFSASPQGLVPLETWVSQKQALWEKRLDRLTPGS